MRRTLESTKHTLLLKYSKMRDLQTRAVNAGRERESESRMTLGHNLLPRLSDYMGFICGTIGR